MDQSITPTALMVATPPSDPLTDLLREAREARKVSWVGLTLAKDTETHAELAELLALFPRIVQVPPLRHHIEDLRRLVPFFLSKLAGSGALNCA